MKSEWTEPILLVNAIAAPGQIDTSENDNLATDGEW